MFAFVIIMVLVALALIVPIGIKEHKRPGFPIVTTFFAAIIVVVTIAIPTTALVVAVGDTAEFVTSIDEYDVHQNLYYDKAENKYFVVEADQWNLSRLQYREYLDSELVEQYLEHKNAIYDIPLFEK